MVVEDIERDSIESQADSKASGLFLDRGILRNRLTRVFVGLASRPVRAG
jgi:hypothetical protein